MTSPLRDSQARIDGRWGPDAFADAFATAAVGMALIDLDGVYRQVNERFCEMLGRSASEVVGTRTVDLSHVEDVAMGEAVISAAAAGRLEFHQAAKRFVRPDGSLVHVLRLTRLVRAPDGRPGYLFAQYVDVTRGVIRTDGLVRLGRFALQDPPLDQLRQAAVRLVKDALDVPDQVAQELVERPETIHQLWESPASTPLAGADADFVEHVAQILAGEARRVEAKSRLQYAASHDQLTGLANRAVFEQALASHSGPVALLLVDLDAFKDINDTWGHAAGDQLLRVVAARLRRAVRPDDTVARLGGDEFAVIAAADTQAVGTLLGRRLVASLSAPAALDGRTVQVGASVGVAWRPGPVANGDRLLADADLALYAAKAGGRRQVQLYHEDLRRQVEIRAEIDRRVAAALRGNALRWDYQPVVDLVDGTVVGVEALVRWDPDDPPVLPAPVVLEAAERTGLLPALGRASVRRVVADLASWPPAQGPAGPLRMSVNLAPVQLLDGETIRLLRAAVREGIVAPAQLYVEVTESAMLAPSEQVGRRLSLLRQAGIRVALDDFGTGYSSLSHLANLPVDVLKLDATFVAGLTPGSRQHAVLRAVLGLADDLGLRVIPEGVETLAQAELLTRAGCRYGQGWLYAPALSAGTVADRLSRADRFSLPRR